MERGCVPMDEPPLGVAVVAGTDASDWGYGNLIWLDGHRCEEQLRFSAVERSKPINWRQSCWASCASSRHGRAT